MRSMFNEKLQLIEKGNFQLVQPVEKLPIRFINMNDDEFQKLYNKKKTFI